jgi:hypothetical protein
MNLPVKMDANNVNMNMIMNMSMYKVCDIFMIMNMQDLYICKERTAKNRFFRCALFVSTVLCLGALWLNGVVCAD